MGPVQFAPCGEGWVGYRFFDAGRSRTVLYLPTPATNIDVMWDIPPIRRFWEDVSRFANVLFFDRRGTGVSDGVASSITPTLDDWGADANAVLEAVGVPRVDIFAQALAVAPALLFAAGQPERVNSMVLFQGFARLTDDEGYDIGAPQSARVADRLVERVARSWGEGSSFFEVHPHLAGDPDWRDWMARLERGIFGRAAATRAYRTWLDVDVRSVVPSVRVPVLVMQGTDRLSPVGAGRWLAENLPIARLFEHTSPSYDWWYLEGRDVALIELERFLTGNVTSPPNGDRFLASVLFTDIVDSTSTATKTGDEAWRRLLDRHDVIAQEVVSRADGRVVKQTGDGVLAVFDAPGRAVRCASELLRRLAAEGMTSRAGLHTGEVERRGEDVAGVAVHLAARIAGVAGPNEVLVSRTIPDLVAGSGLQFCDRGQFELKGVPGSWQLMALTNPTPLGDSSGQIGL